MPSASRCNAPRTMVACCSLAVDDAVSYDGMRYRFFEDRSRPVPDGSFDVVTQSAKVLNALSIEDRERLFEEVNGISFVVDENPEFVDDCLARLDEEIEKVNMDKSAFDLAIAMRPQLRFDRKFRLMFLRSECFHPDKAAQRMVKFFDSKRILFGESKLVKRITFEDLDEDDKEFVLSGAYQILRSKDQAGRSIIFSTRKFGTCKSWKNEFRGNWYLLMADLEDNENAQRRGFVSISYNVGCRGLNSNFLDGIKNAHVLMDGLPVRHGGLHFCDDNPKLRPLAVLIQHGINTENRLRFRAHYGSDMECQYQLMRFGIPQSILPLDSSGSLKEEEFKAYIRSLIAREKGGQNIPQETKDAAKASERRTIPGNFVRSTDILLGKGTHRLHPANLELFNLIESKRRDYERASKFEKTCMSMLIVEKMKANNGRFLKRCRKDKDEWIEVSALEARRSIVYRFRPAGQA